MQMEKAKVRNTGLFIQYLTVCLFLLLAGTAAAQMPHRIAVLVNENSQDSKKAANLFAALHGIPGDNVVCLRLPETMVAGRAECTPDEFRQHIYKPAQKLIEDRGLSDQILAPSFGRPAMPWRISNDHVLNWAVCRTLGHTLEC